MSPVSDITGVILCGGRSSRFGENKALAPIRGEIPSLMNLPAGCAFRDRCDWAVERCAVDDPPLLDVSKAHRSACWEHPRVELRKRVATQGAAQIQ